MSPPGSSHTWALVPICSELEKKIIVWCGYLLDVTFSLMHMVYDKKTER